jgi:hypothetical protein
MARRVGLTILVLVLLTAACAGSSSGSLATSDATPVDSSVAVPSSASDVDDNASDGGGTDPASDVDDSASDRGGTESASGALAASDETPMAASSPIGAFFDGGFDEALDEYRIRVEESIVVCMAAQGFEFVVSANGRVNEVEQRQNELTTREWTAEYGFGISTSFDSIARNQASDPNAAVFFSMSEGERENWAYTLSGGDIGDATAGDFTSRPLEDQGCIGQGLIETGGQEAIEGLETFGSVYEEGGEALYDTREMVGAIDAWARCMSEAGFPSYSTLDDPEDEISKRFEEVTGPMSAALGNLSDEEGQALIAGESLDLEDLPDLDVQALRDVQVDERALALADLDCYEAEVQEIFEPLRDVFEKGLLVEYAAEFGALKNIGS